MKVSEKVCSRCRKGPEEVTFGIDRSHPSGLNYLCKTCANFLSKEHHSKYPERRRATVRRNQLKRFYGLTEEQYRGMLDRQDSICAICEQPWDKPNIDHNHETGQVRDLLCTACNFRLGVFENNPTWFEKATLYLSKHMNIKTIVSDIEYITPKSAKGCPDGWTLEQTAGKLAANSDAAKRIVSPGYTFPGRESTAIDVHPTVPQVDWTSLKKELDKGIKPVPLKGKIEILTDK